MNKDERVSKKIYDKKDFKDIIYIEEEGIYDPKKEKKEDKKDDGRTSKN